MRELGDVSGEVTDLLQHLIRNRCVNDGTPESGGEVRSVDLLESYLGTAGLDVERYEPHPGRSSLVARIEGRDPQAPTLLLMGHTDVVPVNEDRWSRDPFGAELVEGEVWGRGAIDMLNLTSSMAVATRRLAERGFRPEGTLIYLAVADEEAAGTYGAAHLTEHELDAVRADYVVTESGGIPVPTPDGTALTVMVAEKGINWCRLRIRGTAGHASQPYKTDNALVRAAEVVRRIGGYEPGADIHAVWRNFLDAMGYPAELTEPLLDAASIDEALEALPVEMGRMFHACTHTTFAPTVLRGGSKTNVIPDTVELDIDIRSLPGQSGEDVRAQLQEALGDLADSVEIEMGADDPSTESPMDTPLWDTFDRLVRRWYDDAKLVPFITVGATDARFYRRLGVPAYGFGLFSRALTFEDYAVMFHGDDERVDVESLQLSTELWDATAQDLLGA